MKLGRTEKMEENGSRQIDRYDRQIDRQIDEQIHIQINNEDSEILKLFIMVLKDKFD